MKNSEYMLLQEKFEDPTFALYIRREWKLSQTVI